MKEEKKKLSNKLDKKQNYDLQTDIDSKIQY